jgi:hypothetical protein
VGDFHENGKLKSSFRILVVVFDVVVSSAWAATTANFFPLQDNSAWTYQLNGTPGYTGTVILGTTNINGVETKAPRFSDGSVNYLINDGSGIRLHRIAGSGETDTYSPTYELANANARQGDYVSNSGTVSAYIPTYGGGQF